MKLAVLADFEGPHARAWVRWFIDHGHDVHTISFYPPSAPVEGATTHVLRARAPSRAPASGAANGAASGSSGVPRGLLRLAHAMRYRAAGLRRVVREIAPDIFHAHFLVEHGFYGALAGVHPYVVTAWGSDVLVEPGRDPISKQIARWTIGRADLVTSNSAYMAERIVGLGARREKVEVITLGADRYDLGGSRGDAGAPLIVSTRAHEPLYNIGEIIDAYATATTTHPAARLVIAHGGSLTTTLRAVAAGSPGNIEFAGFLDRPAFRDLLCAADVFVSVPSSDATSVALMQAMAAGAFPIVSDLPANAEWIEDGVNGLRVPLHRPELLAAAIRRALDDGGFRARAAEQNRRIVEERGLNETQMAKMEQLYLRLVGRG